MEKAALGSCIEPLLFPGLALISRFKFTPDEFVGPVAPAPRKQLMFILSDELEVAVTDGEIRQFSSGSMILVEDLSCKGQISSVVGRNRCYMAAVPLRGD